MSDGRGAPALQADEFGDFVVQTRRLRRSISPTSSFNLADFVSLLNAFKMGESL